MKPIENYLRMRLGLLFVFILSACSSVKVYDDPFCADSGKFGAECFYTISDKEFSLNKYQWDKIRVGQICSATDRPGEGYVHIKNAVEKLCADSNNCTVEEQKKIEEFSNKVKRAISKAINNF